MSTPITVTPIFVGSRHTRAELVERASCVEQVLTGGGTPPEATTLYPSQPADIAHQQFMKTLRQYRQSTLADMHSASGADAVHYRRLAADDMYQLRHTAIPMLGGMAAVGLGIAGLCMSLPPVLMVASGALLAVGAAGVFRGLWNAQGLGHDLSVRAEKSEKFKQQIERWGQVLEAPTTPSLFTAPASSQFGGANTEEQARAMAGAITAQPRVEPGTVERGESTVRLGSVQVPVRTDG